MRTTEQSKSSVKILIAAIAAVVALSIGAISYAAWSDGGMRYASATGTTGEISVVGDMRVTPINGTGTLDGDNGIIMEKLYPVDHIGDGFTYWAFELEADVNSDLYAVLSIKGGIKTSDGGELFWTFDSSVISDPYNINGKPLNSAPSIITASVGKAKTTVYVFMRAYSVDAINTAVSLTFTAEFAAFDPDKNYESIKLYVPDADGLPVRIKDENGVVTGGEQTVTNGFAEFDNIHGGEYSIEYKGFNAWGTFDNPLLVIGVGYDMTVELANANILLGKRDWVSKAGEIGQESYIDLFVDGTRLGDGWFATKVYDLSDVIGSRSEIRFGFRIYYDGAEQSRDYTILKQDGTWKFQILNSWYDASGLQRCPVHVDFDEWLKSGTPFYFGVRRTKETGDLEVYMGRALDDLVMVGSVGDPVGAKKDIVRFGVVKWRDWGAYNLTLSGTRYGETAKEAFDADINDNDITVATDVIEHGSITVNSAKKSGKVEITLTPDNGYALTELKVNGVSKHVNYNGELMTVTVSDCYLRSDINIAAVFEKTVTPTVTFGEAANGLNVKLVRSGVQIADSEKAVAQDGTAEFPELAIGTYEIWVNAFGVWGGSGKTVEFVSGTTAYDVTLDYIDELLTDSDLEDGYRDISLNGLEIEDGYFVTKVKVLKDSNNEIRFGFRIYYEGVEKSRDYTILKQNGTWWFQVVNSWDDAGGLQRCPVHADFEEWIKNGTSFYFGVRRTKIDGILEVYMGTTLDSWVKVGTVTDYAGAGKNIVTFGIIKYNGDYSCELSEIKYVKTTKETFDSLV